MRVDDITKAIYAHAARVYPEECCGIVTAANTVVPLDNVASNPFRSFSISEQDYLTYAGGAQFVYHSHPDRTAIASDADNEWVERYRLPLMIVSWPIGDIRMIGDPGEGMELEGRRFIYGVYDCYSIVKDFYARKFDVRLPHITRPRFGWWETGKMNPFAKGADCSDLVDCNSPEPGDVLLMSFSGAKVINHIAVYINENQILHHRLFGLSGRVDYNEHYRNATVRILRYAD